MKQKEDKKDRKGAKEHKQPWQAKYATPEEIQAMLSRRVLMRYNEVRHRTEVHWLSAGPVIREDEQGLLTIFGGDGGVTDGYENLTDRDVNTLWRELCREKPVVKQHLQNVIESDYVPRYMPFRYYLEHLPPWMPEQGDAIMGLSLTVNVRGGSDEQLLFYEYLRKWLVAMVASWVDEKVVNNVMLVLIGEQGVYKTTWLAHLLPPPLRGYFYTKTNSGLVSKDDLLVLAEYGLVCWEELDTMAPKELNKLKAAMTMPSVNERAAYERYHENRPHVASFCGTGNNLQFLSDTTGTRRWLPFEVESIESPLSEPFDHDAIFAQAYALYRQGFRYWFDRPEIERLQRHNEAFEAPKSAHEQIRKCMRPPIGNELGQFMTSSDILQLVGSNPVLQLTINKIGRAMRDLGFDRVRSKTGDRGYRVVCYSDDEVKARRQLQASEAKLESP